MTMKAELKEHVNGEKFCLAEARKVNEMNEIFVLMNFKWENQEKSSFAFERKQQGKQDKVFNLFIVRIM
jgi:hypothetical protein